MEDPTLKNPLRQVAANDRELSDFLINLSHEFRTPLAVILLELDQITAVAQNNPELDIILKSIRQIKKNTLRISKVVNNLIDITDAQLGQLRPQVTLFDAVKTIRKITSETKQVVATKHIRFVNRFGKRALYIQADEHLFGRVLLNLLSNAFKHAKKGEMIDIVLDSDGTNITVSVKDQGEGITASAAPRIFKTPMPCGLQLVRDAEGLGIGLSLVRTIIELHHGQVWFENGPGRGSTFYFTLPIVSELEPGGFLIRSLQSLTDSVYLELADLQSEM
jgi:Signal transduction histidine kinase